MTRDVGNDDFQNIITMWEHSSEVTPNPPRGPVISLYRDIIPNDIVRCERFLDPSSKRQFCLDFRLAFLQLRVGVPKLFLDPLLSTDVSPISRTYSSPSGPRITRPLKIAGILLPFLVGR